MRTLLKILVFFTFLTITSQAEESSSENITKLYIATFDRAPDKAGLTYWLNTKMPLEDIATSFFDQPETQEKYPRGYSTIDFINAIYFNLFKRTPDQIGGDYWQKELDKNDMIKSIFILAIINGAKNDDAKILDNKTEVGLAFVNSGSNDISMAKNIMIDITADRLTVENNFKKFGFTKENKKVEIPQIKPVSPVTKPTQTVKPKETSETNGTTKPTTANKSTETPKADTTTKPTQTAKPAETPEADSSTKSEETPKADETTKSAETPAVETTDKPVEKPKPKPKEQNKKDDLPTF